MLPKNTSLGELEIEEIYEFYDIPRLFSCKNKLGHIYLVISIEDLTVGWKWLYLPVSDSRLQKIRLGKITLRDSFKNAEEHFVYSALIYTDDSIMPEVKTVSCQDIPEQWLPEKGERLTLPPSSTSTNSQNSYKLDPCFPWNTIPDEIMKYVISLTGSTQIYINPAHGVPYFISNEKISTESSMRPIKPELFYEEKNEQTPVAA